MRETAICKGQVAVFSFPLEQSWFHVVKMWVKKVLGWCGKVMQESWRSMNIAVVEDEKHIRQQIEAWLIKNRSFLQVDTYACGEELLRCHKYYDIVFLDIWLEGLSGMETARELRSQKMESILIFLTGRREYVFEAFDVEAFHYLLKPVSEKRLNQVFERAMAEWEKRRIISDKRLFIKTRNQNYSIKHGEIVYIESRAKKVEIHTGMEVLEAYASLGDLEVQLGEDFFRCHRGYLVNMAYITKYSSVSITLDKGEEILLAKERYSSFVKAYMRYLRRGGFFSD